MVRVGSTDHKSPQRSSPQQPPRQIQNSNQIVCSSSEESSSLSNSYQPNSPVKKVSILSNGTHEIEDANQDQIKKYMRVILNEMVCVSEEMNQNQNIRQNYNLLANKRIKRISRMFIDKKILQHYFERVQSLYQEDDATDQMIRQRSKLYGMTPEEYELLHDNNTKIGMKL